MIRGRTADLRTEHTNHRWTILPTTPETAGLTAYPIYARYKAGDHLGQNFDILPIPFDLPGTHTLTAIWTPDPNSPLPLGEGQGEGAQHTKTLTVIAKAADFGPDFIVQTYNRRTWTPPDLTALDLQPSTTLTWHETTPSPAPPGEGQGEGTQPARAFTIAAYEPGLHPVLARLSETGDIIAKGNVCAFMVARVGETADAQTVGIRPDGSQVFRFTVASGGLPDNVELRLGTYYQGAVFPDGSRNLVLRAADFGPTGIADVFIEWVGVGQPSLCHTLNVVLID